MNTKNSYVQCTEEDEIDLRELWTILMKRKRLIGVLTGLITSLAIAYVVLVKPIYEVKSLISLAQIQHRNVNNTHDLKLKLDYIYEVNLKGKKRIYPLVSSIDLPKKSNGIVIVKAQGYTNKNAILKLNQVVDSIIKSENKYIVDYINLQNKSIATNVQNINRLKKEIDIYRKKVSTYEKRIISLQKNDAALSAIYAIEVGKKESELNEMQKTKSQLIKKNNALEYSISTVNLKNSKRVGKIEVFDYPVKPKKKLIVIVAFITGVILSVFLAFFLEFIQGVKRES